MKDQKFLKILILFIVLIGTWHMPKLISLQKRANVLQEIHSIQEATNIINDIDSDALVAFDINGVLLSYDDAILGPANKDLRIQYWAEAISKHAPLSQEKDCFKAILLKNASKHPPEKETVSIVQAFQDKSSHVIALTSARTHGCGPIDSVPDWRIQELKHFGFDFSSAFPEISPTQLPSTTLKIEHSPLFKAGCIFCAQEEKGTALRVFLDILHSSHTPWHPSAIVCIDDKIENILSVQNMAKELNLPFYGLYYTHCLSWPRATAVLGSFQIAHLFSHKEWLSDTQAREVLETTKSL